MSDLGFELSNEELSQLDKIIEKMSKTGFNHLQAAGPEELGASWVKEIVKEAAKAGAVEAAKEAAREAVNWARQKMGGSFTSEIFQEDLKVIFVDLETRPSLQQLMIARNNLIR